MHLNEPTIAPSENEEYVADATQVIEIKLVDSLDNLTQQKSYSPEFVHQHFGQAETIVGYKNLKIIVCYSDLTLFIYPIFTFDKMVKGGDIVPDDIENKILDQLPSTQLDALITDSNKFAEKLRAQRTFQPPGQLIYNFSIKDKHNKNRLFQLHKLEGDCDNEAIRFLERAQSLAFWYIDAVNYTDHDDPRFFNYFLFENSTDPESNSRLTFAGYSSLYRFYHHPDQDRVRISHILVAPSHRHSGIGSRFLNAIYQDLWKDERVYDITAEMPADLFIYMRDYVDCVNCCELAEFSKDNLVKGFSRAMRLKARERFKIFHDQARRVYEILRLANTNVCRADELAAFKADVCNRLERPLLRSKRDYTKMRKALNPSELAVVQETNDPETRRRLVDDLYANTRAAYDVVIKRLRRFEAKKFCR